MAYSENILNVEEEGKFFERSSNIYSANFFAL